MRTTVVISDSFYRALHSLKELVLRGLEIVLGTKPSGFPPKGRIPAIDSDNPGSLNLDNSKIYEIISFP